MLFAEQCGELDNKTNGRKKKWNKIVIKMCVVVVEIEE